MELHLTPELEASLTKMAAHEGQTPEEFLLNTARNRVNEEQQRQQLIRDRLALADDGNFIDEEEMNLRFQKLMQD